jgi:hypothetical protein
MGVKLGALLWVIPFPFTYLSFHSISLRENGRVHVKWNCQLPYVYGILLTDKAWCTG